MGNLSTLPIHQAVLSLRIYITGIFQVSLCRLETIETPHLIWYLFKWKTAKLNSVAIKVLQELSICLPRKVP